MKARFGIVLSSVLILSGCVTAFSQKLYPVQGPLSAQPTPAVLTGKTKGVSHTLVSWLSPDGDTFKLSDQPSGWTVASANNKTPGSPESYPPQPNLSFAWDAVYGQGYFLANILGSKWVGRGLYLDGKGGILQLEVLKYLSADAPEGVKSGVAVDNRGNVYKMSW